MRAVALLLLGLLGASGSAAADERILSFHSAITVHANGEMTVHETIRVRAEGDQIRRGIYRDFPMRYRDGLGHPYHVGFELLEVRRDNRIEPHRTESRSNGIRIYAGDKNVFLRRGEYTYTISYRTNRQLGFFEKHDELYWNVTGNGWVFPIDSARATVRLPPAIPRKALALTGYTGRQGSKEQAVRAHVAADGAIEFESTRALGQGEGLTIVAGWPKGFVEAPDLGRRAQYLLRDNAALAIGMAGFVGVLVYYLLMWVRVGRDPEGGAIVPLFSPPHDLTPAAVRYLHHMGFDKETFTAAVLGLAVKGHVTIEEPDAKRYVLTRRKDVPQEALGAREATVLNELFRGGETLELINSNHRRVSAAMSALRKALTAEHHKVHFLTNRGHFAGGVALTLLALLASAVAAPGDFGPMIFMTVWLTVWSGGVALLFATRNYFMGVIFAGFELMALWAFAFQIASVGAVALLLTLVAVNVVFFFLLEAPTRAGRRIMDAIEGFRMYLAAAEKDRLNLLNPPEKTPALFEKYLPYAVALGVEHAWAAQFDDVLARAAQAPGGYRPGWYSGSRWQSSQPASFASGMSGALAGAIASASTAPGSSSGGGGGGSSGGGGGGGGGGGW